MTTSIRHHHSALHVQSLERSASFYVDGLGLQRVQAWRSGPYIGWSCPRTMRSTP
jgi:catechol 2,3-dioxygenase-like lactoylglutathione lyase family enzyme